ncbi:hypothetical protein PTI98_009385 [Pleurotus ostreatus]|nr:hypothetical protein PTI98_009385 [Pleurotus ostreatus]
MGAYLHAQRPDSRYSARRYRLNYLRVCETAVIASYISVDKSPRLIPRINLHPRRVITLVPQDLATRLHMEDVGVIVFPVRVLMKICMLRQPSVSKPNTSTPGLAENKVARLE